MESTKKNFYLCCDDNAEHVIFSKYKFSDGVVGFEISIADSYLQKRKYTGFFGRCRRAWRAFFEKPIVYASIYTEDPGRVYKFLKDCLYEADVF